MCGIAGFLAAVNLDKEFSQKIVKNMCSRIETRGPDAEGIFSDRGIVLGHRRLAILDLDIRANQPMASKDGRYQLVFNGEIYNFRELRDDLKKTGIAFRTTSDSEVLLELFAAKGADMLAELRGMFSFAIWDSLNRELFLARDPYGIKPLYYTQTKQGFIFASQVKAILASGVYEPRPESAGIAGFFLWGSVPEPWTIYKDLLNLQAGHYMLVREGRIHSVVQCSDKQHRENCK